LGNVPTHIAGHPQGAGGQANHANTSRIRLLQ